jgi:hypothetical protein
MKNILKIIAYTLTLCNSYIYSQCINTTPYGTAIINSCGSAVISTCNYALEFSELTFNVVGTFSFTSSVPTDYLTLTNSANVVIAFGVQPLTTTIPSTGGYRLHVSTNNTCGTQNVCRTTSYGCISSVPTTTGCISTTPYGNATINTCSAGLITTCNYGGEYSELTINTTGLFSFTSSVPTDFLTFTDASNNIITSGNTPLNVNISTLGNYRLHVSANASCLTENVCRQTNYSCAVVTPCSGAPTAGITSAATTTLCSAQYVSFGLTGSTVALGLSYQWQVSPNNVTWNALTSFTNATAYLLVNTTNYYRCVMACGTNTSASTSKLITLGALPIGGTTIASNPTSCGGTITNMYLAGASTWAGISYQWQSSSNNITWTSLFGFVSSTLAQNVNTTTYFRCILSCGTSTSASTPVLVTPATSISYANLPYYETFDNTWQNGCDTRDVPNNLYWSNTPFTGSQSWRRQNDGASAFWPAPLAGAVTPAFGAGCANFHSTEASNHAKGDLDVWVNMNQNAKYAISFYYINQTGVDNLDVLLSTNAGTSFSVKGSYNTQPTWTKKTIYYTNSASTPNCIVRFRGNADNNNDDIGIDSLSIRLVCVNPSLIATSTNTTVCAGQTTTLIASGATSYTWMPSGIVTATAIVAPTVNTNYVLIGTNDGLCFPTTVLSVSVTTCIIGIDELNNSVALIYPNPSKDFLNIDFKEDYTSCAFEIYNTLGALVFTETLNKQQNKIVIENLSKGIYFYKIKKFDKIIKNGKLVKQ